MSSNAERWACDTSVAIASLDPSHEAHAPCRPALVGLRPALAGHAAFETYSVLTRLPIALRLSAAQARQVLAAAFPGRCWLDAAAAADDRILLTRDRRAERTYRLLDVDYELVG
jgi:hypothetical protein